MLCIQRAQQIGNIGSQNGTQMMNQQLTWSEQQ